jgi:acyl-CoA oxidase
LAKACTIAIRYSTVRKKRIRATANVEKQMVKYAHIQQKTFPALAACFSLLFTSGWIDCEINNYLEQNLDYQKNNIIELNILLDGLFMISSSLALDGIEKCRDACGGNGFSMYSGIPSSYNILTLYESEKYVYSINFFMILRNTYERIVVGLASISKTSLDRKVLISSILSNLNISEEYNYLVVHSVSEHLKDSPAKCTVRQIEDFQNPQVILRALEYRAFLDISCLSKKKQNNFKEDYLSCYQACKSHFEYLLFKKFFNAIFGPLWKLCKTNQNMKFSRPLKDFYPKAKEDVMDLLLLFGFGLLISNRAIFLEHGYFDKTHVDYLRDLLYGSDNITNKLELKTLALVEAIGIPESLMVTSIGTVDGKYAERMFDMAVYSGLQTIPPFQLSKNHSENGSISHKIPKGNLNITFNSELYDSKKGVSYVDQDYEVDSRKDIEAQREWQEIHALVIKPILSIAKI